MGRRRRAFGRLGCVKRFKIGRGLCGQDAEQLVCYRLVDRMHVKDETWTAGLSRASLPRGTTVLKDERDRCG